MKVPGKLFRILLPVIYFISFLLFYGGMIRTIAEGPNRLEFFFYPSYPGMYILELFIPESSESMWWLVPSLVLVNLAIYSLLGYAIDYILLRLRK